MSAAAKAPAPSKAKGPPAVVKVAIAALIGLVLIGLTLFLLVGQFARLGVRPGFLGTRAGLFADINLVLQVVLLLGLTVGYGLALFGRISAHQYNQTFWALFNLVLVVFIMIVSFFRQVVPGIPEQLLTARLATAIIHSLLGGLTVVLALFIILRMNKLVPRFLRIKWWKNLMRFTLALYWLVGLFGIGTYYFFYVRPLAAGEPEIGEVPAGTAVVPVANYTFNPGVLTIPVGTTVTFRNDDPDPHTVTSDTGAFDEGILEEKDEYSVTFDQPGEFNYFCLYHGAAGGIGMAARIVVGEAAAQVPIPTAVAPPAPTKEPQPDEPPAAPLGPQAVGFAFVRDGSARSDEVEVSLTGLPADTGGDVHLWLTGDADPLSLGAVQPAAAGEASLLFSEPSGANLLGQYSGFLVTVESSGASPTVPSAQVLIENAIPAGAIGPVRQLLVASDTAPDNQAYAIGLIRMSEELFRHAKAVNGAAVIGDFDGMNRHIEHMLTLIQGQGGPDYRDFDSDGQIHDPGDGYGILTYADSVTAQAQAALAAPDGTENVKIHAGHLLILANNLHTWGEQVVDLVIRAHQATVSADQQALAGEALTLTRHMLDGFDLNGNGAIEPIPGEGGAFTLYFHSQYMATIGATAREGSGVTVPVTSPTGEPTATGQATTAPEATAAAPGATATAAPGATSVPATVTVAPPTPTTAAATLAPVFITYGDFFIAPAENVVKVGQQVVFLIQGSLHQPYNFTAPNTFEAPANLGNGTQFPFVFNTPGTVTILCGYHGNMTATVTVQP
jgi:plastocyanin